MQINRIGLNLMIGGRGELAERIVLDIYTGVGMRYCFFNSELEENENDFTNFMWDYGYSETVFLIGLKLGVML